MIAKRERIAKEFEAKALSLTISIDGSDSEVPFSTSSLKVRHILNSET